MFLRICQIMLLYLRSFNARTFSLNSLTKNWYSSIPSGFPDKRHYRLHFIPAWTFIFLP